MIAFLSKIWPFKKPEKRDPLQDDIHKGNSVIWLCWSREARMVISQRPLDLKPQLRDVVYRFLEMDPEKTYPTIKQALSELKTALQ